MTTEIIATSLLRRSISDYLQQQPQRLVVVACLIDGPSNVLDAPEADAGPKICNRIIAVLIPYQYQGARSSTTTPTYLLGINTKERPYKSKR